MRILFILSIAALVLLAGVQLGIRVGLDIVARESDAAYIEQYLEEH